MTIYRLEWKIDAKETYLGIGYTPATAIQKKNFGSEQKALELQRQLQEAAKLLGIPFSSYIYKEELE